MSPCAPNFCGGIYRKDLVTGAVVWVSGSLVGAGEGEIGGQASMSADGNRISFCTLGASGLDDPAEFQRYPLVQVADISAGTVHNGSYDSAAGLLNGHAFDCPSMLSGDGETLFVGGFDLGNKPQAWAEPAGRAVTSVDAASQQVQPQETVATNTTPTPADPVGTAVTTPVAGVVTIMEAQTTDPAPPGYSFVAGQQVEITAPAASVAVPLRLVFALDASTLPAGTDASSLQAFRDGVPIGDCEDASGSATPDPCIAERAELDGGDVRLTILTSHASHWNFGTVAADATPPAIHCAIPDGAWHADNVAIACTATDAGSGLASTQDATFSLSTHVSNGAETAAAETDARRVCDLVDNCATAGPIAGIKVDRKAPVVTFTTPASNAYYALLGRVVISYGCADAGSGVAPCVGTEPSGLPLNTGLFALGRHSFTVSARDGVGHETVVTHSYAVSVLGLPLG